MINSDVWELRWILSVIRRRFWIVLLLPVLTGIIVYVLTGYEKPVYKSSAVLYVQPYQEESANINNMITAGERLALTYSEVVKGQSILESVISQLGIDETAGSLTEKISVEPIKDTQLIRLEVTDYSSKQAALIANHLADALIKNVQTLQEERYSVSFQNIQKNIDKENSTITEIHKSIDSLVAQNAGIEVDLGQRESQLDELRGNYRALQEKREAIQLALSQLPDSVKIVKEAQLSAINYTNGVVVVMVSQPPAAEGSDFSLYSSNDQLALTYSQMVSVEPVLEAVIDELNLTLTVNQLAADIKAEPVLGTPLIQISASSAVASQRLPLANTVANAFITQSREMLADSYNNRLDVLLFQEETLSTTINQIQSEIKTLTTEKAKIDTDLARLNNELANHASINRALQQSFDELLMTSASARDTIVIVERADAPLKPIDHRFLFTVIAISLGLAFGLALSFLIEHLDNRLRTKNDISSKLGLSTLGSIGILSGGSNLIMDNRVNLSIVEDFHVLAANVRLAGLNKPFRKILITSSKSGDGKSVVAANLALALAKTGLRVAVVDADLRIPQLHHIFRFDQKIGLTDAILSGNVDGALKRSRYDGLSVVTSGYIPPDPTEVLNSSRLLKILDELAQMMDLVIIDSPAILAGADTTILSSLVDGILFVVKSGYTSNQEAQDALARLQQANAYLIGAILNGTSRQDSQHNYYSRKNRSLQMRIKEKQFFESIGQFFRKESKKAEDHPPLPTIEK